jgi:hypothetical protein
MFFFVPAALHYNGRTIPDARADLHFTALDQIEFTDDTIAWGEYRLSRDEVTTIRRRFAISFGSCSFREPVDDLLKAGLIA